MASDISLIVTSVFTVILVLVLIWQTRILKTQVGEVKKQSENIVEEVRLNRMEIESTVRPWIGIIANPQDNGLVYNERIFRISLQNYGKIPPTKLDVYLTFSKEQIFYQTVMEMNVKKYEVGSLLPNETTGINYTVDDNILQAERNGVNKIWFGVLAKYHYGENHIGQYGAIYLMYDHDGFERIQQWTK